MKGYRHGKQPLWRIVQSKEVERQMMIYKITGIICLILISLPNLGIALSIPHYIEVFRGMLGPDHPYPGITLLIFNSQTTLKTTSLLWPALGITASYWTKKPSCLAFILLILTGIISLQIAVTYLALCLPTITIIA